MKVQIIGEQYEGDIKTVAAEKKEDISNELMTLQAQGIKGLKVVQWVERDVTDQFALQQSNFMFAPPQNIIYSAITEIEEK